MTTTILEFSPEQVGNIKAQYVAAHGETAWTFRVVRSGIEVPTSDVAKVQALDPDFVIPVVPESVSMFQARAALIVAGHFDQVEAALTEDDSTQGLINRQAWQHAAHVRRDSALVVGLGAVLNLSDAEIDGLFIAAAAMDEI